MAQPGDTIGPYVIDALLAEGGMGAVYRARNRVTGQLRAIKVIKDNLAKNKDFVDRFVREASIASQVRHAHLVDTLEPGIEGETIYLPMELLQGETLHARIRRTKRMSPEEMASILGPVCEGIQALHDKNLVHRDLKPMNVFLVRTASGSEVPKVIDFGTARDVADDEHTTTGMVVGSPFYMSPEQAEGRRDIDGRADQYAVGVMAYQMVTGCRPYESDDTRSALAKLLRGEPYILPRNLFAELPDAVEQVIVRALARERDGRFACAKDLGAALLAAAAGGAAVGMPPQAVSAMSISSASLSAPPMLVGPVGGPASITPPPGNSQISQVSPPPSNTGLVIALAIGALAVIGTVTGLAAWRLAPAPEVTTTSLPPRVGATLPVVPSVAAGPNSVAGTVPSSVVDPVGNAGETVVEGPTPALPARPEVGARTPERTTPETAERPPETTTVRRPETRPPETTTVRPPETTRRPERVRGGSSGTTTTPSTGVPPPRDDEPCGAATGIPCLD